MTTSFASGGSRERRAYVCDACYKAKNPLRVFAAPGQPPPRCPEHGKMRLEKNKPYRPRST